jgi:hypothetical protein
MKQYLCRVLKIHGEHPKILDEAYTVHHTRRRRHDKDCLGTESSPSAISRALSKTALSFVSTWYSTKKRKTLILGWRHKTFTKCILRHTTKLGDPRCCHAALVFTQWWPGDTRWSTNWRSSVGHVDGFLRGVPSLGTHGGARTGGHVDDFLRRVPSLETHGGEALFFTKCHVLEISTKRNLVDLLSALVVCLDLGQSAHMPSTSART